MAYYDNEENAVVNTEPEVSETPATLVGKNLENKTTEDEIWFNENDQKIVQQGILSLYGGDFVDVKDLGFIWGKLSSNPAGFGFTIQKIVEPFSTTATYKVGDAVVYQNKVYICSYTHTGAWNASHFAGLGNPQTLYLSEVYDKGNLVGYVPFYYDQNKREIVRLYNSSIPNYRAVNKGQETPVNVVTEPKTKDPFFAKINLGIKTGEVNIPQPEIPVVEPGTKLYRHYLNMSINSKSFKVYVVSKHKEQYQKTDFNWTNYQQFFDDMVSVYPQASTDVCVFGTSGGVGVVIYIYRWISNAFSLVSGEIPNASTFSDTVTEL